VALKTLRERFDDKVDVRGSNECWPWIGATLPYGYGVISYNGKLWYAHRLAYKFKYGRLSNNRHKCVLRSCLNILCCNPKHMLLGSLADAHKLLGVRRRDLRRGKRYVSTRQKHRILERALRGDHAAKIHRDYPSLHYITILSLVHTALKNNH
jgi:hypothetical protein